MRIHDEHFMVLPPFHNCRYQSILDMYMDVLYIIYINIHDVNIIHLYRYRTRFLEFPRYLDLYVYIYILFQFLQDFAFPLRSFGSKARACINWRKCS